MQRLYLLLRQHPLQVQLGLVMQMTASPALMLQQKAELVAVVGVLVL